MAAFRPKAPGSDAKGNCKNRKRSNDGSAALQKLLAGNGNVVDRVAVCVPEEEPWAQDQPDDGTEAKPGREEAQKGWASAACSF
jgi:hypothetical protein